MASLTKAQTDINSAAWIDLNPQYGINSMPLRLPDAQSIMYCSLYALLNCPVGDRGGIFEPEYGCELYWFLQEPTDQITAEKIRMSILNAFAKWEPRISLDYSATTVVPNVYLPGYDVHLQGIYIADGSIESADLSISK